MFWTEASGDAVANLVCVGRFADAANGVSAAADASVYHRRDPSGDVVSALVDRDPQAPPNSGRTYVLADEFGMMCILPLEEFPGAWLDARAGYCVAAQSDVALADIDELSAGIEELKPILRDHIESLLLAHDFPIAADDADPADAWNFLSEQGLVEEGDMPDGWQPTDAQLQQLRVGVGDSYYESSGLRDEAWAAALPGSLIDEFGRTAGGMFGDYFGFDWSDEAGVTEALERLGHRVIREVDAIS